MTKKQIKNALKIAGVKGYSRAIICLRTKWVRVGELMGKFNDEKLELHNVDLDIKGNIVINL